jgi:predicted outer membrane protein
MIYRLIPVAVLILAVAVLPLPAQTDRGSQLVALLVQDIVDFNQRAIELSRAALAGATSAAVLSHARDVLDYSTKSNALFQHYASKNGFTLRPTPENPTLLRSTDLEMDYMKTASNGDSRIAILLQRQYDTNFGDFELHQLIGEQLPVLRQRLQSAQRLIYLLDVDAQEAPHRVP